MSAWIKLHMVSVLLMKCTELCLSLRCFDKPLDMSITREVNCPGSCSRKQAGDVIILDCEESFRNPASCEIKYEPKRDQFSIVLYCNTNLCNIEDSVCDMKIKSASPRDVACKAYRIWAYAASVTAGVVMACFMLYIIIRGFLCTHKGHTNDNEIN